MKRFLSALLAVFMIATLICVPAFAEGEGAEATAITPDTSWYTENTSASTFYINDAADLLGWAELAREYLADGTTKNPSRQLFQGKTIKLTADIDLNPGWDASVTVDPDTKEVTLPSVPTNVFFGIVLFRGVFDGQGHTISGVYMNGKHNGANTELCGGGDHYGFFWKMDQANQQIKNVAIVNSCMNTVTKSGDTNNFGIAGLLGAHNGSGGNFLIENVYVDVDIVNMRHDTQSKTMIGGIIGRIAQRKAATVDAEGNVTYYQHVNNAVYAGNIVTVTKTGEKLYANGKALNTAQICAGGQNDGLTIGEATVATPSYLFTNCAAIGAIYSTNVENYGEGKNDFVNLVEGKNGTVKEEEFFQWGKHAGEAVKDDAVADFVYSKVAGAVVPATVAAMLNHNAWAQTGTITVGEEQVKALRILTGLENLDWAEVSYTVKVGEKTESTGAITTVYESVTAAGEDVAASTLNANYEYLYGLVIKNIPDNCTLTVTPVVTTAKGTVVTFHSFTVEVVNGEVPNN